jgi:GT2 family glycosyltransferase
LTAGNAVLESASGVSAGDGCFEAASSEPWLKFRSIDAFPPGEFVELRYASSFFDAPVRPLLRFWLGAEAFREHILPAPCEGVGVWIGRVPEERTQIWISPTNRPGRFSFEAIAVRPVPIHEILSRAARAPKRLFFAACAGMVGLRAEAELNWRWALGAEPCSNYGLWSAARRRPPDPAGLDSPRCDWRAAPRVSVIIDMVDATAAEIEATLASLGRQLYLNWRALLFGAASDPAAGRQIERWTRQANVAAFSPGETGFLSDEILCRIVAGDRLEGHALACAVEYFSHHPEKSMAYADETHGDGESARVTFKPGWSAVLRRSVGFIGRSAFFRANCVPSWKDLGERTAEVFVDALASGIDEMRIGALHRPLFSIGRPAPVRRTATDAIYAAATPSVAIVIPSRDQPELLGACLKSVFERTKYANFRVAVIDNESVDPRALALVDRYLAEEARFAVLKSPGAFNFSALCNLGAERTPGDFLLFLNNDTEIQTADWLQRLLYFASQSGVGAVGAKLLFPHRKTQHVGVVLGMGGVAGHFGAGLEAQEPGWTQRNLVPHEVSAVTGACLMVERRKFEAVGGFDAVNLPVELNDVDLCLRLAERGWRAVSNTQVELIHRQSASRGGPMRLQSVYEKERRFFYERWRRVIRDDPYFHPGLSLHSYEPALP